MENITALRLNRRAIGGMVCAASKAGAKRLKNAAGAHNPKDVTCAVAEAAGCDHHYVGGEPRLHRGNALDNLVAEDDIAGSSTGGADNAEAHRSGAGVDSGKGVVAGAACGQVPLTYLKGGEAALVVRVRGGGDLHHHLETLGFVQGARIAVVSEAAGNLIVEVKGTQIALGGQVASRIMTKALA